MSLESEVNKLRREKRLFMKFLEDYKNYIENGSTIPEVSDDSEIMTLGNTVIEKLQKRINLFHRKLKKSKTRYDIVKEKLLETVENAKERIRNFRMQERALKLKKEEVEELKKKVEKYESDIIRYRDYIAKMKEKHKKSHQENYESQLKLFLVKSKEIDLGPMIGKGAFGQVHSGVWSFQKPVAVKVIKIVNSIPPEVMNEFHEQISLVHPCVIRTYGYSVCENEVRIVMEKMDCNLTDYIRTKKPNFFQKLDIMEKMVEGLMFLHQRTPKILHRDIKSLNFLLPEDGSEVKICDFGMTRTFSESSASYVVSKKRGTPQYLAPEIIHGNKYSIESDIYALGISFWEVMFESVPYEEDELNIWTVMANVSEGKLRPSLEDSDLPEEIADLLKWMWSQDRKDRPTAEEVFRWFKETGKRVKEKYDNFRFPCDKRKI